MDERLFQATTLLALRPELSSSASSRLGTRSRVSVAATPATVKLLTQWTVDSKSTIDPDHRHFQRITNIRTINYFQVSFSLVTDVQ